MWMWMDLPVSKDEKDFFSSGSKYLKGKEKQKNIKDKVDAPKPKEKNQHQGKEKVKCSYCGKGFHPEHACMKKKLDEATSLLEMNHINLPERFWRRDQHDREP